jgi:hypothetical protein
VTAAPDDLVNYDTEIDDLRAPRVVMNRLRIFVALPA